MKQAAAATAGSSCKQNYNKRSNHFTFSNCRFISLDLIKLRQLVKLGQSEDLAGLNETRVKSFSEIYAKYHYVGKGLMQFLLS
jgi:hypothetical protein